LRGILIASLAFVVAAAPALAAAAHLFGPPVVAQEHEHEDHEHDDDCDEKDDHDGDHAGEKDHDDGGEKDDDDCPPAGGGAATTRYVVVSSLLIGLESGASFPVIDTTPRNITRAHITITDGVDVCTAGASSPFHIRVNVGVAGGTLVNVMTPSTNTGIGDSHQCVFHVTIVPGANGVPAQVTDIIVQNVGEAALTGVNSITVSAEVA
jgi:hypothetical protein